MMEALLIELLEQQRQTNSLLRQLLQPAPKDSTKPNAKSDYKAVARKMITKEFPHAEQFMTNS